MTVKAPDLLRYPDRLSSVERLQIRAIRHTFEQPLLDRSVRRLQRLVGSRWITAFTSNLAQLHGLENVPQLDPAKSYILVSNHRSFFDLYVVTGNLVQRGMQHRILFPVRAKFFYDAPLGFVVNGVMSFFAMYPPIYRERSRAALNLLSLDEIVYRLKQGGYFAGIHPEGTRKLDDDPYTFLPAQSGVGRVIHKSRAVVLPVFVNGLINDLPKQVRSNFDRTGRPIHVVFGAPIDFGEQLDRPGSPRVYKALAERCMQVIGELGQQEKQLRASY